MFTYFFPNHLRHRKFVIELYLLGKMVSDVTDSPNVVKFGKTAQLKQRTVKGVMQ
jgi:hypothetical protein